MPRKLFTFLIILTLLLTAFRVVNAVTLEDIDKELGSISEQLAKIQQEQANLQNELDKVSKDLNVTVGQINALEDKIQKTRADLGVVEAALQDRKSKLDTQVELRNIRIRNYYQKSQVNNLELLLGNNSFAQAAENLGYHLSALSETKQIIESLNQEIAQYEKNKMELETAKKSLEANLGNLARIKNNLASKKNQTTQEITKTEEAIKSLSARQQELISLKTSSFSTSVGDVPLPDDLNSSIGFKPPFSPAFAVFSYGAPHRVGMSQYGAYGRAKSGQNAETIIQAYFAGTSVKKDYPIPSTINVSGYGTIPFEENYLKGIAEVPSSWGDAANGGFEALKAQAVLARTYAIAVTAGGGSICPTEACQVYIGSNKGGNWERAVNETRGWVLVDGAGAPVKAWYSSTTGGFTHSSQSVFGGATSYAQGIADTVCGNNSCWTSQAYEVKASSPWFYKAWYKNRSGSSGGRTHPWLTGEEFADITNALLLFKTDPSLITHLSQTDAANPDTWNPEQLKTELRNRGKTPANKIVGVSPALYHSSGYTSSVNINADSGAHSFTGSDFRFIFNLRAPGRMWIPSLYSGSTPTGLPFFNIEQK